MSLRRYLSADEAVLLLYDLNGDGRIDAEDYSQLCEAIRAEESRTEESPDEESRVEESPAETIGGQE